MQKFLHVCPPSVGSPVIPLEDGDVVRTAQPRSPCRSRLLLGCSYILHPMRSSSWSFREIERKLCDRLLPYIASPFISPCTWEMPTSCQVCSELALEIGLRTTGSLQPSSTQMTSPVRVPFGARPIYPSAVEKKQRPTKQFWQ